MAGVVAACVEAGRSEFGWDVIPAHCPALSHDELEKRGGSQPLCQQELGHGERRHCIHCVALVRFTNANHRVDAGSLLGGVPGRRDYTHRDVGVLCLAQRRNRPPGC